MNISFNCLKKYVNLPDSVSAEEVAEKLKLSTVEVEGIVRQGKDLENIIVGKVISAEKHPNADKLKLCKVDAGNEQVQVVCGGSNVREGMLVALAKVGAKVRWHGEGELAELKPAAIRGADSFGMICASTEIGLGAMFPSKEEKEILDLSFLKAKPGMPVSQALNLNDAIFEIDNKSLSNRPDLWGHYGMAREVAALYGRKLKEYQTIKIKPGKEIKIIVEVENKKLCPRYMAVAMSGIKAAPSPEWLQKSLSAAGLRPINNIVDITNYIMLDLGQPMHAFDAAKLAAADKKIAIRVRTAGDEKKFTTLDGVERKLSKDTLLIADSKHALAIGGVMGGLDSGISDATDTIIFESANFDAGSIRRTSTRLGLRTDSSSRFEKSLDPNLCEMALCKAVEMVLSLCPGAKAASNLADESNFHLATGPIVADLASFDKKIGGHIPEKKIVSILQSLGFGVNKKSKEALSVTIPTWRATKDISITEDLAEEVLRIYGYENIAAGMPSFPINPPEANQAHILARGIKNILSFKLAATETDNYAFVSARAIANICDDISKYAELDNPLSKETPYLRRNLLINILENTAKNITGRETLKLFEIGKTYLLELPGARVKANSADLLPRQDTWLAYVCTDKKSRNQFWEAKRAAESILKYFGYEYNLAPAAESFPWQHPGRAAEIRAGGTAVGWVYEVHPRVAEAFGIDGKIGVLELNLDELSAKSKSGVAYESIPEFPTVERDLAVVLPKKVAHAEITALLQSVDPLLHSVKLFDVYEGENIGADKKSMAYRLTFLDRGRTLSAAEADAVQNKIIKILQDKFKAEVRK
jgi:phenylalanyl-tRNA synthetase beta chain